MANGWKITAIIFIILFILETAFIGVTISVGMDEINNEERCSNEICFTSDNLYDAYQYYDNTCYCMKDGEIAKTKYLE